MKKQLRRLSPSFAVPFYGFRMFPCGASHNTANGPAGVIGTRGIDKRVGSVGWWNRAL